jgi:thymidylate synthase
MKAPITNQPSYVNANNAFIHMFEQIMSEGEERNSTKVMFNIGFYIMNPLDRDITCTWRKWKDEYAIREWDWYMTENRSVSEIKKFAKMWDKMHGGDDIVNSNYGWQWNRNDQLELCIQQLQDNPSSRQAYVTIYDGKEKDDYAFDTPCTMFIGFLILEGKLCMNVSMRSNDLVYGFCNDQYCFSKLQETVANILGIQVGWYYHHSADMHIYERHYNLKNK